MHKFNIAFMFDIYEKNRYNSINLEKETGFRCMRLRNYYSAVTFYVLFKSGVLLGTERLSRRKDHPCLSDVADPFSVIIRERVR